MNTIRLNTLGEAKAASSGDIKNQDKSVEIVENGVTEVTADSGYTGLGKVTINANVQGGESGGDTMEYLDMTGFLDGALPFICSVALNVKWDSLGDSDQTPIVISPFYLAAPEYKEDYSGYKATILAIAIDFNLKICNTMVGGELISIGDCLTSQGLMELLSACPRITKEQFYTI